MRRRAALQISAALLALAVPMEAAQRWIHLRVVDRSEGRVEVNLPFSLVERALPLIPQDEFRRGEIRCNDHEFTVGELREIRNVAASTKPGAFSRIELRGTSVDATRQGDDLLLRISDDFDSEESEFRMPFAIADALVSGPDPDELDLAAAVQAMKQSPTGHILSVRGEDSTVTIWLDEQAASEREEPR